MLKNTKSKDLSFLNNLKYDKYQKASKLLLTLLFFITVVFCTNASDLISKQEESNILVIIDHDVKEPQIIIDALPEDLKSNTHVLRSGESSLAQVLDLFSRLKDRAVDEFHLFSHGAPGTIYLGGEALGFNGLDESGLLKEWKRVIPEKGEMFLYGCEIAKGQSGHDLITKITTSSYIDVAASVDVTGSKDLGGDWDLEYFTANNHSAVALDFNIAESYQHLLQTTFTFENGTNGATANSFTQTIGANTIKVEEPNGGTVRYQLINFGISSPGMWIGNDGDTGTQSIRITLNSGSTFEFSQLDWVGVLGDNITVTGRLNGNPVGSVSFNAVAFNGSNFTTGTTGPINGVIDELIITSADNYVSVGLDNVVLTPAASSSPPTVTTTTASSVSSSGATLGGNVTDDGGASVTARGFVYSSTDNTPEIGESNVTQVPDGSGTGVFNESITGLSPSTTYYFAAYATNSEGTDYGSVLNFNTLAPPNSAPTDIALDNNSINQSATGVNATVGTLTTTDADAGDSHTYSLVAGTGDTDNGSFNISGSTLRTSSALAAGNYSVRINTNDGTEDYAEQFTITVTDDVAPVVTSVSVPIADTYVFNQNLDFTVNFDENITVNTTGGTPQLALTVGSTTRQAVFQSGSGTQNLVFRYTVQDGDADGDGIAVGTLSANGGTLRDAANNDANLTLNSVGNTSNVNVLATDVTYSSGSYSPTDPSGLNLTGYTLEVQDGTAVITAATTFDDVTVQPDAILDLNANLTVNNELLFQSDATGSGQLADASGVTISGNVTAERYMSAHRAFRLVSSPVTTSNFISNNWQLNTHITGASGTIGQTSSGGFDQTPTGNPSMFTFNNGYVDSNPDPVEGPDQSPGYTEIPNTNATNLQVGTAYVILVRGDRSIDLSNNTSFGATTLSATGTAHTGRYPSAPGSSVSLSQENDYWSLVANPYQAKVDYNLLPKNDLRQDIAVRDPDNNSWQTLTGTNRIIEPGQSFFVQNVASVSSATLYFEEADKATGGSNGGVVVFNDSQEAKLDLELYNQNNERKDILKFRFSSNYNSDLDDNDFGKLINDEENIASYHPNMLRSIDRRNIPQDNEEVLLNLSHYQNTSYELRIKQENWDSNIDVYVKDNYLNTTTQITPDLPYQFNIDTNIPESIAEDRFSLTFDNTTLSTEENTFGNNFRIHPNPTNNGRFSISTPNLIGEVELEITNLLGQKVYNERHNIENQKVQVEVNDLSSGLYIVKVKQEDQSKSVKLIHK